MGKSASVYGYAFFQIQMTTDPSVLSVPYFSPYPHSGCLGVELEYVFLENQCVLT